MMEMIRAEGMQAVAREFDSPGDPEPDWYKRQILETNRNSFLAAMEARLEWPGMGAQVGVLTMPSLFLGGENEFDPGELEAMVDRVPNGTAQRIPGVSHVGVFARSDLVLPHVKPFLERAVGGAAQSF
jgi:pimeloyl-ACP methyl ester carboxylesterase